MPSIAPGGMAFYSSPRMPGRNGSVCVGALARQHLARPVVTDGRVALEAKLILGHRWRVRAVAAAPDGALWFGVDGGMLVRITPAR